MSEIKNGIAKYVLPKYQDLKAIVKEKGTKRKSSISDVDRYYVEEEINLGDKHRIIYGSVVDDSPKTEDEVKFEFERTPSNPSITSDVVRETFTEKMIGDRLAITYNYLERVAIEGSIGEARFEETFDAVTGEKIKKTKD
ncbi:MAG: hypothetical protein K8T10_09955 [Candidatus Eremiobacteraeota bacterium]|nr:hypothetical protein [Candidatus Eremiobacteraeota bacterium]